MLQAFLITTITMLIADAFWLTLNVKSHTKLIEATQKAPINLRLIPALLVYILMPAATTFFAIEPSKNVKEASVRGALLGFSMYGLYDLTNLATLNGWTYEMLVKDTLWGTTICALGAASGFYFSK
jgi:uncharacterized membrane protein